MAKTCNKRHTHTKSCNTRPIRHTKKNKSGGSSPPGSTSFGSSSGSSSSSSSSGSSSSSSSGGARKHKSKTHKKGGAGASNWVISNFGGSTEQQFMNTFGPNSTTQSGSLIPTLTGAPAVLPYNVPQGSVATYVGPGPQNGGKRKGKGKKSGKKGGYWAQVIEQALVPFGLVGLQNMYGSRKTKKNN